MTRTCACVCHRTTSPCTRYERSKMSTFAPAGEGSILIGRGVTGQVGVWKEEKKKSHYFETAGDGLESMIKVSLFYV